MTLMNFAWRLKSSTFGVVARGARVNRADGLGFEATDIFGAGTPFTVTSSFDTKWNQVAFPTTPSRAIDAAFCSERTAARVCGPKYPSILRPGLGVSRALRSF